MAIVSGQFTRDALTFLTNNAIAFDYTNCVAGVNRFVVEEYGDGIAKTLRRAAGVEAGFDAYFLSYADGETHQLTLGSQASYMFTPPLTGCSFFIDKKWWSPKVAHGNRQTAEGGIDQPAIDADARLRFGGDQYTGLQIVANYYAVKKDDYTPPGQSPQDNRVYVVGIRGNLGWTLYKMKHDPMTVTVVEPPTRIN